MQAYRLLISYAIGFIYLETGGFFRQSAEAAFTPPTDPGAFEQFPLVLDAGPHLLEWDAESEFEAGIDAFLSHLRARASGGGSTPRH